MCDGYRRYLILSPQWQSTKCKQKDSVHGANVKRGQYMRLGSRSVEAKKVHLQRLLGFLSRQGSHLDMLSIKRTHIFHVYGG